MELYYLYISFLSAIFFLDHLCDGGLNRGFQNVEFRYRNVTRGDNYDNTEPNYGKRCGFPIIMPSYPVVPTRQLGKHYSYLGLHETDVIVNGVLYYIGRASRILVPSGFTEAQVQRTTMYYYDTPTGDCQYYFAYGYQANDGRYFSFTYDSHQPNNQGLESGIYLFDDYKNVEIVHYCDPTDQNLRTGFCEKPNVYVNTRVRPDEMSSGLRRYVDETVDRVMAKYCLSRNDFYENIWTSDRPACDLPEPACYSEAANGYDIATGYYEDPS